MTELKLALLQALHEKAPETAIHADRVCDISRLIADHLNMSAADLQALELAAILHDVGKIATPDLILNKQSSLTDSEWDVMKDHASAGARILRASNLAEAHVIAAIVEQTHEHFDGTGYPLGLVGTEILLQSRIIEVADCFDALTYYRVYHKVRSAEDAIRLMDMEPKHDPEILAVLKKVYLSIPRAPYDSQ